MARPVNTAARERILCAALGLFHERGLGGVSMDDIARAAGVKKANLFHYFPTKEELAMAAVCRGACSFGDTVRAAMAGAHGPIQAVRRLFEDAAAAMRADRCSKGCFIGNLAQEVSAHHERLRARIAECLQCSSDELAAFLDGWRKRGHFSAAMRPRETADAILSLFEGAMLLSKARRDPAPLAGAARSAESLLGSFTERRTRRGSGTPTKGGR